MLIFATNQHYMYDYLTCPKNGAIIFYKIYFVLQNRYKLQYESIQFQEL